MRRRSIRQLTGNTAQGRQAAFVCRHVGRPRMEPVLQAVTAGTTADQPLDVSKLRKLGDRISDGSVVWEFVGLEAVCPACGQVLGTPAIITEQPLSLTNVRTSGFALPIAIGNGSIHARGFLVDGLLKPEWEQVSRDDGLRGAAVTHDVSSGVSVASAHDRKRLTKDDEEREALKLLALALSNSGTTVTSEWVPSEKGEYEDGWLYVDGRRRVGVQVRHLDAALIARLGKERKVDAHRQDLVSAAQSAIAEKAGKVPSAVRDVTILALYSPAPVGRIGRRHLRSSHLSSEGFREVWVCPHGERAFRIDQPKST